MFNIEQLSENKPLNRFIKKTRWLRTVVTSRCWRYLCHCCCSVPSVCGYSTLNASVMVWLSNPNCYIPHWLPRSNSHCWKIYSIFGILLIILRISKYQNVYLRVCVYLRLTEEAFSNGSEEYCMRKRACTLENSKYHIHPWDSPHIASQ